MIKRYALAFAVLAASTAPAFAHLDPAHHGSFFAGISHPLFGLDHILVMVAVGLWAAMIGGRSLWVVPSAFIGTMALGYGLSLFAVPLPFVEPVILASVVALGLLVATAAKLPIAISATLVGLFALFHGHAHGGELGLAAALPFGIGFALATPSCMAPASRSAPASATTSSSPVSSAARPRSPAWRSPSTRSRHARAPAELRMLQPRPAAGLEACHDLQL